jgi:hypothetical protein
MQGCWGMSAPEDWTAAALDTKLKVISGRETVARLSESRARGATRLAQLLCDVSPRTPSTSTRAPANKHCTWFRAPFSILRQTILEPVTHPYVKKSPLCARGNNHQRALLSAVDHPH